MNQNRSAKVVVLSGPGKVFRLHKERIVIGSVVSADVRLIGDDIAPIHAVLEVLRPEANQKGEATIYDLASESGVSVNGMKIVTETLKSGDEITIGNYTLKLSLEDPALKLPGKLSGEGRKLFFNPKEDFKPLLLEDEREVIEIFDYSQTHKTALQAVMSWNGTILNVEHFVNEKAITIGETRQNDFGIPPVLSSKRFELVRRQGTNFTLNLDPKMSGVIQKQGQLKRLDECGSGAVALDRDDFAKINVKGVDFYLSFTAAPPRLKWSRIVDRDPFFLKVFGSSIVITALTIAALLKASVPQNIEAEKIPDRIATILYQPEKFVHKTKVEKMRESDVEKTAPREEPQKPVTPPKKEPEPKQTVKLDIKPKAVVTPREVPKEMTVAKPTKAKGPAKKSTALASRSENEAKEGKGAKAKGKEGKRGSPKAPPGKEPQTMAKRPSAEGGPGRGSGSSQVPDEGNVDLLKGATSKIQDLLGNSAANLGKGGEKLQGFGAFTTLGDGGLALEGSGKGGGGDAASLGGLANEGRGGGRVGTGRGASGSGSGIVGGKTRVVIRSGGPEEAIVMGAIDADAIEAALLAHRDEFRLCYEREINAENPKLAGRVGTNFVIGSSGRVNQAGVESTTLNHPNAERCILQVIKRIQFPIPRGAGIVQVTYPFKFSPAGG